MTENVVDAMDSSDCIHVLLGTIFWYFYVCPNSKALELPLYHKLSTAKVVELELASYYTKYHSTLLNSILPFRA